MKRRRRVGEAKEGPDWWDDVGLLQKVRYLALCGACVFGPTAVAVTIGYLLQTAWAVPIVLLVEVVLIGCWVLWIDGRLRDGRRVAKEWVEGDPILATLIVWFWLAVGAVVSVPIILVTLVLAFLTS